MRALIILPLMLLLCGCRAKVYQEFMVDSPPRMMRVMAKRKAGRLFIKGHDNSARCLMSPFAVADQPLFAGLGDTIIAFRWFRPQRMYMRQDKSWVPIVLRHSIYRPLLLYVANDGLLHLIGYSKGIGMVDCVIRKGQCELDAVIFDKGDEDYGMVAYKACAINNEVYSCVCYQDSGYNIRIATKKYVEDCWVEHSAHVIELDEGYFKESWAWHISLLAKDVHIVQVGRGKVKVHRITGADVLEKEIKVDKYKRIVSRSSMELTERGGYYIKCVDYKDAIGYFGTIFLPRLGLMHIEDERSVTYIPHGEYMKKRNNYDTKVPGGFGDSMIYTYDVPGALRSAAAAEGKSM